MNICQFLRPGDWVTIIQPHAPFSKLKGRVVMRSSYRGGWVINCGGRHGTPAIATDENIIAVKPYKPRSTVKL